MRSSDLAGPPSRSLEMMLPAGVPREQHVDGSEPARSPEMTLPYNVNGLDTEGFVRLANGEFWLTEEYSPSLVRVDPSAGW